MMTGDSKNAVISSDLNEFLVISGVFARAHTPSSSHVPVDDGFVDA